RAAIAAQRQADPGVRVAFAMTSPTSHAGRALRRAGFVGRPSEWPLIARVLAGPESEQQLFGSMSFMAGDSDTV
ncbi:MAG: hypothetical protein QOG68_275, partial [Solirubrobacteraceae bacterium]|nr:hypothetical protein [Solirubrobacteraceae bacterium]